MSDKGIVYRDQDSQRLDLFITAQYKIDGYTRSYWTHMIQAGLLQVNGSAQKPGYKLRKGDTLKISWPEVDRSFESRVSVIYEDDDVIVINKPAGMLTHSKGAFNPEYTVADFIAPRIRIGDTSLKYRAGIVHRLDRYTSGVLVATKTEEAQKHLQAQFEARTVSKLYVAVVEGKLAQASTHIDAPLARDPKNPKRRAIQANGKAAQTDVLRIQYLEDKDYTTALLSPKTGRTHQLRVHLAELGHPIAGDELYGAQTTISDSARFLLHAYQLTLKLPSGNTQTFIAPLPNDMSSYIEDDKLNKVINEATSTSGD